MWSYLEGKLHDRLLFTRITDKLQGGISDVNYLDKVEGTEGWVELKYLEKWPKDRTDLLSVGPHGLQPDQALFLNRRVRWCSRARAGVLLRIGTEDWIYWRALPDLGWLTWIRGPDILDHATLWLRHGLDDPRQRELLHRALVR